MNNHSQSTPTSRGTPSAPALFRPQLAFYKANARGTGSACKFELHPAHDRTDGSIFAVFANQATVGDRSAAKPTFPTFDWAHSISVKLDFNDLCKLLQVLRGECESLENGKGLVHMSNGRCTHIKFTHHLEPSSGYMLEVFRNERNSSDDGHGSYMFFNSAEALGLCESISGAMSVIAFGMPMIIPHSDSESRERKLVDEHAA